MGEVWLVSRSVVAPRRGKQGRPSFCEQKEAKKLFDCASRPGVWRLCPLRPTGVARRMKFFARFFSKKRRLLADSSVRSFLLFFVHKRRFPLP
jgi:hypothetical protein